ncbi:2Fe-2S iron-sulfur cluster-binding protein [Maribacter sp. ACAM166]|uniref:2Fe-2S iron-sulfur cluster-binding protein n=1 Tax=Maribacter sp. ACAM166 TaxID=2508996 RepID=UPI0010FF5A5B|nr:2Fe-2S iron-sulfur cluster-binding protein [Maribacter sp. ACAM166]TLP80187.1 (2Fe-2S)-binding protein [Maribacter sp. ACAM166]
MYFIYFNEFGEEYRAEFRPYEYHNLMELLFDKYIEEWGDCKGRAWCGTCHIQILEGHISETVDSDERNTLSILSNVTGESRLACQIPVTSALDGIVFKILKDDGI